jgi:N-acetylmuramoyl-L-alanine amidase
MLRSASSRAARGTTLATVTGLARRWGRKPAIVFAAAVGVAALVAAGGAEAVGVHDVAPRSATGAFAAGAAKIPAPDIPVLGLPLKGKIIGIDPGHNGRNYTDPAFLNRQIWNGREYEDCDTTGTVTDGGYTEALFNFRVAEYLRADLIRDGARVVMTRTTNDGIGPCVDRRAAILDGAHANVAVDIHADGGPQSGRGFAILEPVADGPNNKVIGSSVRFGADVRASMLARTSMPVSTYDGKNGIKYRDDLAGLNLTTVPKILIEVGNMKNGTDAKLLTSAKFQQQVASALLDAIIAFLR